MNVCRMRKTPITFINKMDLDGRDVLDLLDNIETVLGIETTPFTLPIGYGKSFAGVFGVRDFRLHTIGKEDEEVVQLEGIDDPELSKRFKEKEIALLRERYEMVTEVMTPFSREKFLAGEQMPVFFGVRFAILELNNS